MSVTFCPAIETVKVFDGEPRIVYVPMSPEGFDGTPTIDPECPEYGACVYPVDPWELNVSNANARLILDTIGMGSPELCGLIVDLDQFISQCDAIIGVTRDISEFDAGSPARVVPNGDLDALLAGGVLQTLPDDAVGPTIIDCGLRPGYLNDKFTKLREIALIAKERGAVISYA